MRDAENNQIVVKSNRLVEASYRLTTQEQRIILFMASMVKMDDEDFQTYRIKISEFVKIIGVKGHSKYHEVKHLTKKLLERVIVIKEQSGDLQIGWVSSAKYFNRKGFVELHFDPKLRPYLLKIKEYFTKYKLIDVIRLKRSYSIRIYELLKQYEKIGKRTFELDEIRKILGIGKDKYKLYGHLKSKVIKPAQKELSEHCDLTFSFNEIKKGRKVIKLEFLIIPNKQKKALIEINEDEQEHLFNRLQDYFCLSAIKTQEIIGSQSTERIIKNLAYVEEKYKGGKIKDIGPYTIKAIEEDYNPQKSFFDIEKKEEERAKKEKEQKEKQNDILKLRYNKYRSEQIKEHKKRFSKKDIELIEKSISEEVQKNRKNRIGINTFVRIALDDHYAKQAKIPSFQQWKIKEEKKLKN